MNELDSVTQQNAAMFEETTAASHALTGEADALAKAVAQFNLPGNSNAAPKSAARSEATPAETPRTARASVPATAGNAAIDYDAELTNESGWEEF